MKYLQKKSVVKIPPASGSVTDTLNVTDKTTNAPSVRLVQELIGNATGSNPVEVPTKVSQLENDSGFITADDIPEVSVPTKVSQLENDSGFITVEDIPDIPESGASEILWTNSSPTSSFSAKTITLTTNTYKYFRIFYKAYNTATGILSTVIRKGDSFDLNTTRQYTPGGTGYLAYYYRNGNSSSQNSMYFSSGYNVKTNSTAVNTDNTACVPVQVVGFN